MREQLGVEALQVVQVDAGLQGQNLREVAGLALLGGGE